MPQQQYLANLKKGMGPGQAMQAAYPGGGPGSPSGPAGPPGMAGSASAATPPRPGMPAGGPPGQGGAKGSAVQQVLSAGQRLIQMASQLGILDQLKQMIAQADKGPAPTMGGGIPRPPTGGEMAGGGAPGGGIPGRKPPGMI